MPDLIKQYSTARIPTMDIGQTVDQLINVFKDSRRPHERRWYDNNFFDDGYHFRYLRRTDNKIVDLSERSTLWNPMRAIPKASRQIRGVANLLVSQDYTPIVYPDKLDKYQYPTPQEYQQAQEEAKKVAKQTGHFLEEEFKKQEMVEKIAHMVILAAKHSIAWMQIWPDAIEEAIRTQVYDAFDIYTLGTLTETKDLPSIIKGIPKIIADLKADERFDPVQLEKISPDNKQASSEIKDAYMRTRYGRDYNSDQTASLILKEAFIKEYLSEDNRDRIAMQENGGEVLQGKKDGDMVMRHTFVAGNIWLKDEYVDLPDYPFVDYRMEPGPMYQVPLIERFIPQNKSYDMFISRAEKFANTMTVGAWAQKSGEQYKINNSAGGQVIEYQTTPPTPLQLPSIPAFYFQLMNMVQANIEEQGVTTSILGKVPAGVKANAAIESLKESEYQSLVIPQRRLKGTIKRIAEKMLDIVDDQFVTPQTVYYMEKGEPQYFDVIGANALKKRQALNVPTPDDVIPVKKDYRVDIEVQAGMAYTREGQKAAAKELGDYMVQLAERGLIDPKVVSIFLQTLLETYNFGPTGEIMEAIDEMATQGNISDKQVDAIKVAVVEVMKDLIKEGILPDQEQRIEEGKVAVVEGMKDFNDAKGEGEKAAQEKEPSKSISFKDLPPEGKAQLAAQAGIQLNPEQIRQQEEQDKQNEMDRTAIELALKTKALDKKGEKNATDKR